jgi:AcrR family transcriptional regulator
MGRKKKTVVRSPRQSRGVDTVRFILDAADRILADEGPAAVTTKHVARVAGVGIGTVYQYFPDRGALLREVERRAWTKELDLLLARLPDLQGRNLEEIVVEVVSFTIDGVAARVLSHGLTMDDVDLHAARFELLEQAEEIVFNGLNANLKRMRPANLRLAVRVAIEASVLLAWIATLRDRETLKTRAFHREVGQMLARYLIKDSRI